MEPGTVKKTITNCTTGVLASFLLAQLAFAQAPQESLEERFWGNLYKDGGETFYCKKPFTQKSMLITESYIYSTSWIRDHLRCGTPKQCREESPEYQRITSDLHNIVPADARIDLERSTAVFEELPDEVPAGTCGLKRSFQIIEPPDDIKGDIARAILYMVETYNLPLQGSLRQYQHWNTMDPPSPQEIERNRQIQELQGNSNRFIDNPRAVDFLDF